LRSQSERQISKAPFKSELSARAETTLNGRVVFASPAARNSQEGSLPLSAPIKLSPRRFHSKFGETVEHAVRFHLPQWHHNLCEEIVCIVFVAAVPRPLAVENLLPDLIVIRHFFENLFLHWLRGVEPFRGGAKRYKLSRICLEIDLFLLFQERSLRGSNPQPPP
jgi:hypothetical protein